MMTIPIVSIRTTAGIELTELDFGTISADPTPEIIFRVYNNYGDAENVHDATDVKVGLTMFENTGKTFSLFREFESEMMDEVVEIDCTHSSEFGSDPDPVGWQKIQMTGSTEKDTFEGWYYGDNFDTIKTEAGFNFNEYKIRLNGLPTVEDGDYGIYLMVDYNW